MAEVGFEDETEPSGPGFGRRAQKDETAGGDPCPPAYFP